jgi:ABC-type dipeptide/oligopeptide/nickel transport system permease subunit
VIDWNLVIGLSLVVAAVLGGIALGFALGYRARDRKWR